MTIHIIRGTINANKRIDFRFLEDGEKEELDFVDDPVSQNNFSAIGTKDYMRIMSNRAPLIHDSHGAHFDRHSDNVPLLYSNINYGDEKSQ